MFALLWVTLFLSVNADKAASDWGQKDCSQSSDYCVTLNGGEVTAEAGLCTLIPCSFTTAQAFKPTHIIWFKCEPQKTKCTDSDPVFSDENKENVRSEFKGRVSLLEPDISKKNCSIMINDLRPSDSGSYQLRVVGDSNNKKGDGWTYAAKTSLLVTGLTQKPTVMIPPLTEGQQTTLTCTAPGLCSGSPPQITWTFKGKKDIPGNMTELHIKDLTSVTQRHSSTLIFTPSAEHHNMKITCRIRFTGNFTKKDTVTLNVSYVKEVQITGDSRVKEGGTLNLTCRVESFPPSAVSWSEFGSGSHSINQSEEEGISSLYISDVTVDVSGLYICTAKHGNKTLTKEMNVTVMYKREPQIVGNTAVNEGDDLNLTCSVDSFPPSLILWTKHPQNDVLDNQRKENGISSLFISNVTAETSGLYICTVTYLNTNFTEEVNLTVTYSRSPQISGSTTVKEGDDLHMICSVDSFPPSEISWTKIGREIHAQSYVLSKTHSSTKVYQQDRRGSGSFYISNVTAGDAGVYSCTAEHLNSTLREEINVKVIYKRKLQIVGNTFVKEGEGLNLTCSLDSFPPSLIMWTKHSAGGVYLHNDTGSASLFIPNVTAEDSGRYTCTAKHLEETVTVNADVSVTWFSKILAGSRCVRQSGVLTCVCVSEGFPLPTIRWPLLKDHTEYHVITTVSNHTVNSSVTIKHHGNNSVQCFSSNEKGEAKENLTIQQDWSEKQDQPFLGRFSWLELVVGFLFGVLLSAVVCFLATKFYREKNNSGNLVEALEMISEDDPLEAKFNQNHNGRTVQNDQSEVQEGAENEAVAAEKAAPKFNRGPKEPVYASIDFSRLSWNPRAAEIIQENTKTVYAEIKTHRGRDNDADEMKSEQDENLKECVQEVEEDTEEAVYSSVTALTDEI